MVYVTGTFLLEMSDSLAVKVENNLKIIPSATPARQSRPLWLKSDNVKSQTELLSFSMPIDIEVSQHLIFRGLGSVLKVNSLRTQ